MSEEYKSSTDYLLVNLENNILTIAQQWVIMKQTKVKTN